MKSDKNSFRRYSDRRATPAGAGKDVAEKTLFVLAQFSIAHLLTR
jgi:hypothetical protein